MKRITAVFLLLLSLFLVGCGADISAYQDREILVVGLAEEDFSVTPGGSSGNWVRMVTKIEFVPLESEQ